MLKVVLKKKSQTPQEASPDSSSIPALQRQTETNSFNNSYTPYLTVLPILPHLNREILMKVVPWFICSLSTDKEKSKV